MNMEKRAEDRRLKVEVENQKSESKSQTCAIDMVKIMPAEAKQTQNSQLSTLNPQPSTLNSQLPAKRVVFLDRDGVINRKIEGDYVKSYDEFTFLPGAIEAIKGINEKGRMVIIITNQSGIGRGIMSIDDLAMVHEQMLTDLKKEGVTIDAIYYCPHSPDNGCDCRKPKDGLFKQALMDFNIDIENSWMIGDELKDIEAGKKAGCKTYLLSPGELLIDVVRKL